MLEPPTVSNVALGQLAAWEDLARDWATYEDWPCMRCVSCHVNVYRIADDDDKVYSYTPDQRLALTVAHLRQAHMELDPDRD